MCLKKNLIYEITKTVKNQLKLKIKKKHSQKDEIDLDNHKNDQKEVITNTKLILKVQERFKNERYKIFTEEINKTGLKSNDDKKVQSNDSIQNTCL